MSESDPDALLSTYVLHGRVVTMDATAQVIDQGAVYVRDGTIVALEAGLAQRGAVELDAGGNLVTESFVNPHLHLDKVFTLDRAGHPVLFWLSTLGLVLMGSCLLAIALGMAPAWLSVPASSAAAP